MPLPVTPWTTGTPIDSKSLNLALYTIDGTLNKPQGILLHGQRPMSFEVIGAAGVNLIFDSSPTGHRTVISAAGDTEPAVTVLAVFPGCQHDHGNIAGFGVLLDPPAYLETVQ